MFKLCSNVNSLCSHWTLCSNVNSLCSHWTLVRFLSRRWSAIWQKSCVQTVFRGKHSVFARDIRCLNCVQTVFKGEANTLCLNTKNRSRAPCIPWGRYVPQEAVWRAYMNITRDTVWTQCEHTVQIIAVPCSKANTLCLNTKNRSRAFFKKQFIESRRSLDRDQGHNLPRGQTARQTVVVLTEANTLCLNRTRCVQTLNPKP